MTRSEFLEKLQKALENDLHGQIIQEHINYYNNYIIEEMRKGRAEESVTEELGDPWMISRTLIEAADNNGSGQERNTQYESEHRRENNYGRQNERAPKVHVLGMDGWWKKLLFVLGIIGVLILIVTVIGGLFALVAPILLPLLVIIFVLRLFGQNRR